METKRREREIDKQTENKLRKQTDGHIILLTELG